jgi:uncharacterized protein YxjI
VFSEVHEIYLGGERVAQVRHAGFFGDRYDIETSYGPLTARGRFAGGDYTLSQGGVQVASMTRKFSLREKFAIDVADDANVAFLLAVMLAIEAIHDDRRDRGSGGGGLFG